MKRFYFIFVIIFSLCEILSAQKLGVQINTPFGWINKVTILNDDRIFVGTQSDGLFYSPNNGDVWLQMIFPWQQVGKVFKSTKGDLYVNAYFNGLYKLENELGNWEYLGMQGLAVDDFLETPSGNLLFTVFSIDPSVVADFGFCGLYLSKDQGVSWRHITNKFDNTATTGSYYQVFCFDTYPDGTIFAGAGNAVFKSTTGEFWTYANVYSKDQAITITSKGTIFLDDPNQGYYYTSTDEGTTWNENRFTNANLSVRYLFHDKQDHVFIVADSEYTESFLYKQSTNPNQWVLLGELNYLAISDRPQINSAGDILYRSGGSLIKIDHTKITSTTEKNNSLIHGFSLSQNYPNPFNPTTTIEYSIPKESFVTLKVYDVLGKEVVTLVNENKQSGRYRVKFDADKLASGIFLCRMQAGGFMEVKKIILIK
jgi:hypothetical protein